MDPFVNKVHLEPSCAVLVHVCGSFPAKVAEPRQPSREEIAVYRNSCWLLLLGTWVSLTFWTKTVLGVFVQSLKLHGVEAVTANHRSRSLVSGFIDPPDGLKSVTTGVFTPGKSADASHQCLPQTTPVIQSCFQTDAEEEIRVPTVACSPPANLPQLLWVLQLMLTYISALSWATIDCRARAGCSKAQLFCARKPLFLLRLDLASKADLGMCFPISLHANSNSVLAFTSGFPFTHPHRKNHFLYTNTGYSLVSNLQLVIFLCVNFSFHVSLSYNVLSV